MLFTRLHRRLCACQGVLANRRCSGAGRCVAASDGCGCPTSARRGGIKEETSPLNTNPPELPWELDNFSDRGMGMRGVGCMVLKKRKNTQTHIPRDPSTFSEGTWTLQT